MPNWQLRQSGSDQTQIGAVPLAIMKAKDQSTDTPTGIVCGDDDHRRELAAEGRGERWQQVRQGSARTDD